MSGKPITVAVWVSGGVVQGARADAPGVVVEVYDADEFETRGLSEAAEAEAERRYESLPHPCECGVVRNGEET